jgi:hypothetical protein
LFLELRLHEGLDPENTTMLPIFVASLLICLTGFVSAINNGVGLTPAMGYKYDPLYIRA